MELKLIRIGELEAFLASEVYRRAEHCPITRHRALSQVQNPAAEKDDPALLLAIIAEEIVGYVGFLPDHLNGEKVFWNSCWWAATAYRRLAMPLFLHFIKQADENVLLTDMPSHTLNIIQKLRFFEMRQLEAGLTIYWGIKLSNWIPRRFPALSSVRPVWRLLDNGVNSILRFYFRLRKKRLQLEAQPIDKPEASDIAFINQHSSEELIGRGAKELEWIVNDPWVLPESECAYNYDHYHFTATARRVHFQFYRLTKNGQACALLLTRIIDQHLFVPYAYYEKESLPEVLNFVQQLALENTCVSTHSFRPDWKEYWLKNRSRFLFSKTVSRSFAFHQKLSSLIPGKVILQDGDGDVAFC